MGKAIKQNRADFLADLDKRSTTVLKRLRRLDAKADNRRFTEAEKEMWTALCAEHDELGSIAGEMWARAHSLRYHQEIGQEIADHRARHRELKGKA